MLIYCVINSNLLTTIKYMNALINMSSYQVSLYILCVILNFLIIMHYIIVTYYIHIFVMPRYHCKCDWCWIDWATLHQRIKCLDEKHKCHDYRVWLFKKKKKIIFNTCTFYLFIYDKPIHALILYEQRKRNKAYTLGISCKWSWGELLYWKSKPFYHNCYMFDCQDF